MSLNPHPIVLTNASERHRAELFALVVREQFAGSAQPRPRLSRRWSAVRTTRAMSGVLALLLAAVRQG